MKRVHWLRVKKLIVDLEQNQRSGGVHFNGLRSKWGLKEVTIRRSMLLFQTIKRKNVKYYIGRPLLICFVLNYYGKARLRFYGS